MRLVAPAAKSPALPSLWFLLILVVSFSALSPHFLSVSNFSNILSAVAVIGLMALGGAFVISSGGIDLSTASVMALSGTGAAILARHADLPPLAAVAVATVTGASCGLLTGWLVTLTRAPSFIITLGMLSVARAAAFIISRGLPVYGLPEGITALGQGKWLGAPGPALIFAAGAGIAFTLLRFTRFGAQTLALGDNEFAARAMGLPIPGLRRRVYTLAGAYSGIAGFVFTARTNAGDPAAGQGYELIAITAIILGGTSLFGGRGSIAGTVLGALCLGVLQNGLNLLAVSTYYQILFVGAVLIAAARLGRLERAS